MTGLLMLIIIPALIPAAILKVFHFPVFANIPRTSCNVLVLIVKDQLTSSFHVPVRHVYPGIFISAFAALGLDQLREAFVKWAQSVRDSEYLVALRLQNMEDRNAGKREAEAQAAVAAAA